MSDLPRNPSEYTVDFLARLLCDAGLMTEGQRLEVLRRENVLRERLMRERTRDPRIRRLLHVNITPAEIITAAGLHSPDRRTLNEDRIMETLGAAVGLPWEKIDPLKLNEKLITETMSRPFARQHVCLPLRRLGNREILFAIDNPFDYELRQSLMSICPQGFELVLSSRSDILRIITDIYGFKSAVSAAEKTMDAGVDLGNLEQLVKLKAVDEIEATDQHVVNAVEYLLHYAFEQRASDIHIEPRREEAQIRLRIDGVLHTIYRMPRVVHNAMISRIKMLSRMDIAERRRPQDGRMKTDGRGGSMELRVSTLPVAFGEKVVIRIFDPETLMQDIESLGMSVSELYRFRSFLGRKHGMVLVTGPTGSGKTTTLYSTLRYLESPDVNISTVEDPIEMVHEGFNQTLVQPRIGLTFDLILRNILRQDPDVIMVGEIRDEATAQMAIQAALTGHLVFSTLHTNDAPSAITRLQDLGVPDFLLATTIMGVVAQRLVRKICDSCRTPTHLSEDQCTALGIQLPPGAEPLPVWYGEGCPSCRNTGMSGRTGIYEIMEIDGSLRRMLRTGADSTELRREALANGMTPLRESAIRKLAAGETSYDEVIRVLGDV